MSAAANAYIADHDRWTAIHAAATDDNTRNNARDMQRHFEARYFAQLAAEQTPPPQPKRRFHRYSTVKDEPYALPFIAAQNALVGFTFIFAWLIFGAVIFIFLAGIWDMTIGPFADPIVALLVDKIPGNFFSPLWDRLPDGTIGTLAAIFNIVIWTKLIRNWLRS